ncbi:MAG TPA: Clp protease ClpS [Flavobacteriales bacterium]|jgi:ATP-dependent Clp protease adaptor protein ClpS|nr:Clp protease ClpS [Flavobacteriales bacterium]
MGTQTLELTSEEVLLEKEKSLILYNDEVNTFDFVIDSLMKVCKHEPEQAEQCTFIVHFKGKCDVSSGPEDKLLQMCSALLNRGLTAEIE